MFIIYKLQKHGFNLILVYFKVVRALISHRDLTYILHLIYDHRNRCFERNNVQISELPLAKFLFLATKLRNHYKLFIYKALPTFC